MLKTLGADGDGSPPPTSRSLAKSSAATSLAAMVPTLRGDKSKQESAIAGPATAQLIVKDAKVKSNPNRMGHQRLVIEKPTNRPTAE